MVQEVQVDDERVAVLAEVGVLGGVEQVAPGLVVGVAVDPAGNVYLSDTGACVVEKVTPSGTLSVVAGDGTDAGPTPGPATSSALGQMHGIAVDASGAFYLTAWGGLVEKVTPSGTLSVIAGNGAWGVPTPVAGVHLSDPESIAVDSSGSVYVVEAGAQVVKEVTPDGVVSVVAGTGTAGAPVPGPATSSPLNSPSSVAVDGSGNLYVADQMNQVVERIAPDGTLSVVAGTGAAGGPTPGPAIDSDLEFPDELAVDPSGDLYFVSGAYVVKVAPDGTLSVVAGSGRTGAPIPGPALDSPLRELSSLAVDADGDVYFTDLDGYAVGKITAAGLLSIVAGNGIPGTPTPGPATGSRLGLLRGVALDASGNLLIADSSGPSQIEGGDVVALLTPDGSLSIVAGDGRQGVATPGPATSSALDGPSALAADSSGNVYVANSLSNEVVRLSH